MPKKKDAEEVVMETTSSVVEEMVDKMMENDAALELLVNLTKTFEKRRFNMLSKDEQAKVYHNEHIAGGKDGRKTEVDLMKEEAEELRLAAQSVPPTILKGTIYGYETSDTLGVPMVLVTREDRPNFVIKIPVSQLFMYDEKQYDGEEGRRALAYELNSRMNSEIEFVVYDVLEAEKLAIASRLKAMELRAKSFYKARKGKKKAEIEEGSRTFAKVVSVKNNRVKVEMSGIETTLRSEDLSWRALEDLRNEFKVGQEFEVIVHDIEEVDYESLNKTYKLFTAKASRREALPNPAELFYSQFKIGQRIGGVIKAQNEHGVFVDLAGKMDVLCPPPAVGIPVRGDKCIIEITKMDDKTKRLFGRFVS